jgi:DNA-binding MarR family transcriptional regulator
VSIKESDQSQKYFELWELLARTRHAIYSARELELKEYGLSPEQAYILNRINQLKNKATQTQIAHFTFRKQNTVSTTVKRMEKQGLIERKRNEQQGNSMILSLTSRGEEILKKTLDRKTINSIMSSISAEQYEQMRPCLETLFAAAVNELAKFNNKSFLKSILEK